MKAIAVFAAILAVSSASPQIIYNGGLGYAGLGYNGLHHGLTYAAAPVPVATKTQYHAQDELGQASFGHSQVDQSHNAVRDAAGGVRGTFSYISPEGIPFTTHYVADHNGYRVASNALPVAPAVSIHGPIDTPEVAAAKVQHAAAHHDALVRSGRKKRGVVSSLGYTPAATSPLLTAAPVVTYAAAPAITYAAAAPAFGYGYAAGPAFGHSISHGHGLTYASAPGAIVSAPAVRAATLTRVVNNPGHAISYRVD